MGFRHDLGEFLEENPYKPGPSDVRLKGYGVPVWALIGHMSPSDRDPKVVAANYELPVEAVRAAFDYYQLHRCEIESRLAANEAAIS